MLDAAAFANEYPAPGGTRQTTVLPDGATSVAVDLGHGERADCTLHNVVVDLVVTKSFHAGACAQQLPAGAFTAISTDAANNAATNDAAGNSFTPGTSGCYTIVVDNNGSSATSAGFTFSDPLPTGVSINGSATCSATAGSDCAGNGASHTFAASDLSLDGSDTSIAAGGSLTIEVPVDIASAASSTLTNKATVNDPFDPDTDGAAEVSATLVLNRNVQADIGVAKEDVPDVSNISSDTGALNNATINDVYVPGTASTYRINVCNFGPSDVTRSALGLTPGDSLITLTDTLPSGVTLGGGSLASADLITGVTLASVLASEIAEPSGTPSAVPQGAVANVSGTITPDPLTATSGSFTVDLELPALTCAQINLPYTPDQ